MADLTVTAAQVVLTSGETGRANAAETITAGQAVYLNGSSLAALAQSDGTAAQAAAVGIALHGALAGQPLTYAKHGAVIDIGATTAAGLLYYLSNTAGGVCPVADLGTADYVTVLGYGIDTGGEFTVHVLATGEQLA